METPDDQEWINISGQLLSGFEWNMYFCNNLLVNPIKINIANKEWSNYMSDWTWLTMVQTWSDHGQTQTQ